MMTIRNCQGEGLNPYGRRGHGGVSNRRLFWAGVGGGGLGKGMHVINLLFCVKPILKPTTSAQKNLRFEARAVPSPSIRIHQFTLTRTDTAWPKPLLLANQTVLGMHILLEHTEKHRQGRPEMLRVFQH